MPPKKGTKRKSASKEPPSEPKEKEEEEEEAKAKEEEEKGKEIAPDGGGDDNENADGDETIKTDVGNEEEEDNFCPCFVSFFSFDITITIAIPHLGRRSSR